MADVDELCSAMEVGVTGRTLRAGELPLAVRRARSG